MHGGLRPGDSWGAGHLAPTVGDERRGKAGGMSRRRSDRAWGRARVGRAGAVLFVAAVMSCLPAAGRAQASGDRTVRFRFQLASLVYNAPLRGSFSAAGAIVDHATASGLIWPVYHRFPDGVGLSALWLSVHARGGKGAFSYRTRVALSWLPVDGFSDRGPVVVTAASGVYRHLAPLAYTHAVTIPGPLPGAGRDLYLRSRRFVTARLFGSPSTSAGRQRRRR